MQSDSESLCTDPSFCAVGILADVMVLNTNRKKTGKGGGLECWTSAIEADVYRTGELVSKRMDVLVSRDFRVSKGVPRKDAAVMQTCTIPHAIRIEMHRPK